MCAPGKGRGQLPARRARRILGLSFAVAAAGTAAGCSTSSSSGTPATVTVTPSAPSSASTAAPTSPSGSASAPSASPPSTSGQAVVAACTTAGLRVSKGDNKGAAGTIYTNIDFTNTSGSACVLEGYAGVSLVSAGDTAATQIGDDAKRTTTTRVRPVTLASGQTAHAVVGVAEAGNFPASKCRPVIAHWMKVFPPNQRTAAFFSFTTKTCGNSKVPTMTISAISAGS